MPPRFWLVILALLMSSLQSARAGTGEHRVLTALPAVHALTSALSEGTAIRVHRLPPGAAAPMEGQASMLSRVAAGEFQQADAVVTLSRLWQADALYATARRHNLRIVEIDASRSWDAAKLGVSVVRAPSNDVPWADARGDDGGLSPYAWLGIVNAMRMAALIAADLARLSPTEAPRIEHNLAALEGRLRRLKAQYAAQLADVPDPRVLSLASEFAYLFAEFGIFVDGWFVKQDIAWSDSDRAALTRHLRERGIRVVVHKWKPDEKIAKAIAQGGARLLVLDVGDPGILADATQRYEALVTFNMDALLAAFATAGAHTSGGDIPPRR